MSTEATTPTTYRLQPGCQDCEHCRIYAPQDDPTCYFCMKDQPAPPPCPPNYDYIESLSGDEENPSYVYRWALFDWTHNLPEVAAAGICDFHEIRK